jgi:hypothetical protein
MTTKAPPAPPPKTDGRPPAPPGNENVTSTTPGKKYATAKVTKKEGQRIVIYGEGGIGKTSLAALAPNPVFIDFDRSGQHFGLNVVCVDGEIVGDWAEMREALHTEKLWESCNTIVVDSATTGQGAALAYTLATVKHEKDYWCKSIEEYGFGKGYRHLYDTFLTLLADLEYHTKQGRHVVLVCHSLAAEKPNPTGEDFLQYQPDLQNPKKEGRLRDKIKGWCDDLVFIEYDVAVSKDGKAKGGGSRTIYGQGMPTYWAKSRTLTEPVPFVKGSNEFWIKLLGKEAVDGAANG